MNNLYQIEDRSNFSCWNVVKIISTFNFITSFIKTSISVLVFYLFSLIFSSNTLSYLSPFEMFYLEIIWFDLNISIWLANPSRENFGYTR